MVRISGALVILLVAAVAGSWQRGVVVVYVAARAWRSNVHPGKRESGVVVIERRGNPGTGVVADIARSREARGSVIGVRGAVEVRHMTG